MSQGFFTRLKENLGLQEPEPADTSLLAQINEATTLSRTQRIYGFATCVGLALLFGFLASFFFFSPTRFAILYTFSNLAMISSTMFLMGPWKQLTKMFEKGRLVATLVYLASLVLTLFSALYLRIFVFTLVFFIIQLLAMVWYALSYIPYAREVAARMFSGFVGE